MNTKTQSLFKTDRITAREKVFNAIQAGPSSRNVIAQVTGLKMSSVCGRVNELLHTGRIRVAGAEYDGETNRVVETLALSSNE